jgi:RNA polymerase sigma factor (sigma-70 family)
MSDLLPTARGPADGDVAAGLLAAAQDYLRALRRGLDAAVPLREAWRAFFAALDPLVRDLARACRCPPSRLGDGVQEVWTVIVVRLPDYQHDPARGRFRDWLYVVVRHTLGRLGRRDARAALGRADPRALAATAGREPDPAEACVRRERGERILATLVVLHDRSGPIAYRAVTLHWLDGRPAAEVAAELHLTPGQLRGLLDRAKTTLRARLERDG